MQGTHFLLLPSLVDTFSVFGSQDSIYKGRDTLDPLLKS